MLANYRDIKSRIAESPKWYDSNGTPRYNDFTPSLSPNIYAKQVVLLLIRCQNCGQAFSVEMNWDELKGIESRHDRFDFSAQMQSFISLKRPSWSPLHYGDPPPHNCVGDTMNCIDVRILEFWTRSSSWDWERISKYEVELEQGVPDDPERG